MFFRPKMKHRKDRFEKMEVIRGERIPMQAIFPAPVVMRGHSYYVRLPPEVLHYYELENKDVVLVSLLEAQRVAPAE